MKFVNKLQNQRILIFGGTSGIGFAVAEGALEHGAQVIISGSNEENLARAVQRLRASYPDTPADRIATHACDLSEETALDANIAALLEAVTAAGAQKLNHVVFTAGDAFAPNPIAAANLALFQHAQTVRLLAPIMIAKHAAAHVAQSADSSMTVTSGAAVEKPAAGSALLVAVGSAIEGLARGLAVDLAPVRVNCVAPGAIRTELLAKRLTPERAREYERATKVGRLGAPEDAAEAYLYAMRDGFVTGALIKTNGGWLL